MTRAGGGSGAQNSRHVRRAGRRNRRCAGYFPRRVIRIPVHCYARYQSLQGQSASGVAAGRGAGEI